MTFLYSVKRRAGLLTQMFCFGLFLFAEAAAQSSAAPCASCAKPQCARDIWIIETHAIGMCEGDLSRARFLRLNERNEWITESEATFLATLDPGKPLNFQLPGYLTNYRVAIDHLWKIQHQLDHQAACRGMGCANLRLVMWKWPSELDRLGIFRDVRDKAARANFEGTLLSKLLVKLPKEMRVNFVAYSYGARIGTTAAHHLALAEQARGGERGIRLSAVLIASAVDAEWLQQCHYLGMALPRFERVLLFTNSTDRLLRRYRVVNRNRQSPALGLVGLLMPDAASAAHVRQWEVSHLVGRAHDWHHYIESPTIMHAIADFVFYLQ